MSKIIKNLKNPRFTAKSWYIVFLPLALLSLRKKRVVREWATMHWDKNPKIMHRLYWVCSN